MKLIDKSPGWVRDMGVTLGSSWYYFVRRMGIYNKIKKEYKQVWQKSYEEQKKYQQEKFEEIFWHAKTNSRYYARKYQYVVEPILENLPILEKEELRQNMDKIVIGDKKKMIEVYTGGTTGKSLVIPMKWSSLRRHIALISLFWEMHNYHFRDKFAWFSGRKLLSDKDVKENIFWRTNYLLNIRYYSTFHTCMENMQHYVRDLNNFKPQFFNGFPSAIYEVANFMTSKGVKPEFKLKGIFTTSETVHPEQREIIESIFGCKISDQYSSSEGAPFIIQCPEGNLHMDLASGIFEVINEQDQPADEGEILVTSFTMWEVPIIRYRIGDRIKLTKKIGCDCGWDTPIVAKIMGRKTDYLEIPGRGKIWCSQFGDCVKGISSVVKFQVELVDNNQLRVHMVASRKEFEKKDRENFLMHLHERVGNLPVTIVYVDDISRSQSGKHSVIKKTKS